MSNRFVEAYDAEFDATLGQLVESEEAVQARLAEKAYSGAVQYNPSAEMGTLNKFKQAGQNMGHYAKGGNAGLPGTGDIIKQHMSDAFHSVGDHLSGAAKSTVDAIKAAPGAIRAAANDVSFGAKAAAGKFGPEMAKPGGFTAAGNVGHALQRGASAIGRSASSTGGKAGLAGLGLVGAAALAHKAYSSLKGEGNHEPSPDELHERMKAHHEEDGGDSGGGGEKGDPKMVFGRPNPNYHGA